jgi:hypothetical protein
MINGWTVTIGFIAAYILFWLTIVVPVGVWTHGAGWWKGSTDADAVAFPENEWRGSLIFWMSMWPITVPYFILQETVTAIYRALVKPSSGNLYDKIEKMGKASRVEKPVVHQPSYFND